MSAYVDIMARVIHNTHLAKVALADADAALKEIERKPENLCEINARFYIVESRRAGLAAAKAAGASWARYWLSGGKSL